MNYLVLVPLLFKLTGNLLSSNDVDNTKGGAQLGLCHLYWLWQGCAYCTACGM